ncbi:MAG: peptidase domain-containing ABC transporter, partial [Prochlorococcus sp.]
GAVRLIADDPATGPFTLARLGVGDALGWCGLIRGRPSETAIAMEPTLMAAIPSRQFLRLIKSEQSLRKACLDPDRSELAELLLAWLGHQPDRYEDVPGFIAELWRPSALRLLSGASLQKSCSLDQDWLWLPSAPLPTGVSPGIPIEQWNPKELRASDGALPLGPRLLGVSRDALEEAVQARSVRERSQSKAKAAAPESHASQELWDQARAADDLPDPIDPRELGFKASTLSLPPLLERGEGPLDSAMVCLKRLASRYHFPFPRDMVQQVLLDSESRLGGVSLLHLGQVLESLGLEVRPLRCPSSQVHRLQPPALIRLEDRFLLVEEAGAHGLVVSDPSRGIVKFELAELRELWPEGIELMLVRPVASALEDEQATRFDLNWFSSMLKQYRPQVVVLFLAGFVDKLLDLVFPLATIQIIQLVMGGGDVDLLMPIAVIMATAIVVMVVLSVLRQYVISDLADRLDTSLGSQIVGHLFRLPLKFFDRRTVGDLASRINDLQRVRTFITGTAITTVIDLIFIPIVVIVLYALSPILATISLIQVPITFLNAWISQKPMRRLITRRNRAWGKAQGFLVEVVTAIRTVKSQNFATQARWQWLKRYRHYAGEDFKLSRLQVAVKEVNSVKSRATRLLIVSVGALLAANGIGSVGGLFGVMILSGSLASSLQRVSEFSDQYENAKASMDSLADVLGQQPEESADTSMMLPMPTIQGSIDFERVSFSYGINGRRQLDDFNLNIASGQIVGLVGASGSGKSTVVQLMDGLYQPDDGRLYVDGTDVSKVQLGSLRRQVGFVPQESILFNGSVLDNLRLNLPDAPYESVIEAAKVACAHQFIMKLPDGYNTQVGERGGGLSGGQKQRVAIARMVLQNPNLVILDEATSALDPTTEYLVLERLRERFAGRTMVIVTHRVASLREADRILFMDQGVILEDGSWEELINLEGSFAVLVDQQISNSNA